MEQVVRDLKRLVELGVISIEQIKDEVVREQVKNEIQLKHK